jgi:hypothetical protein
MDIGIEMSVRIENQEIINLIDILKDHINNYGDSGSMIIGEPSETSY